MAPTKRSQLVLANSLPGPKRIKVEVKAEGSEDPRAEEAMNVVPVATDATSMSPFADSDVELDMIKLLIGSQKKTYFVHAHLLLQESYEHYAMAVDNGMDRGYRQRLPLQHQEGGFTVITDDKITQEETPLFSYVIEWLYGKDNKTPCINDLSVGTYTRLWTLADKIRMPRLNNHIMRILVSRRNADRVGLFKDIYETVVLKKEVFENMERDTQMHDFVISICARSPEFARKFNLEEGKVEKYGKGFMEDLVSEYASLVSHPEREDRTRSAFRFSMGVYDEDGELVE